VLSDEWFAQFILGELELLGCGRESHDTSARLNAEGCSLLLVAKHTHCIDRALARAPLHSSSEPGMSMLCSGQLLPVLDVMILLCLHQHDLAT
jgi:hypothetical protein